MSTQQQSIEFTRIENDSNGNPRYVCSFEEFLLPGEYAAHTAQGRYDIAAKRANKIGGRKFNTKQYAYGIAFQSYNTKFTEQAIIDLMKTIN